MEAEYWLIGGETALPEQQAELINEIERLGLHSCCRWFPRIEYTAIHRVYAAARASGGALVVTSIDESFGMSVLEALISGCPVIASRVGALPEIAPGKPYVLFYEFDDAPDATQQAVEFCAHDDAVRESLDEICPGCWSATRARWWPSVI